VNATIDPVARFVAYAEGRAFTTKSTALLAADPPAPFGVAFIKMVAEEVVQAVAFGDLTADPQLLPRWNPLSRESGDLGPFAAALHAHLVNAIAAGQCPRVWLPHESALTVADLLGWRYRGNPAASAELQRMGVELRALSEEYAITGQQAVVVATALLREHVVTGQAPVKDGHLGALLAWLDPPEGATGEQVAALADRRALIPASGVLEDRDDDRAEDLRRRAKAAGDVGPERRALDALLESTARREWRLLQQAREAWLDLGLSVAAGVPDLAAASRDRIAYELQIGTPTRSRGAALANLLDTQEGAQAVAEDLRVRGDSLARERARLSGHVIGAVVVGVTQQRPGFRPCRLTLQTDQPVIRLRRGARVTPIGTRVTATVLDVTEDPGSNGWRIDVDVSSGVRSRPGVGARLDWVAAPPPDLSRRKRSAYRAMQAAGHPLAVGGPLPAARPRAMPDDLLAAARALRTAP
jgi:hypothetical protein